MERVGADEGWARGLFEILEVGVGGFEILRALEYRIGHPRRNLFSVTRVSSRIQRGQVGGGCLAVFIACSARVAAAPVPNTRAVAAVP